MTRTAYRVTITETRFIEAEYPVGTNPLVIEQAVAEAAADHILGDEGLRQGWILRADVNQDPEANDYHPHMSVRVTTTGRYEELDD